MPSHIGVTILSHIYIMFLTFKHDLEKDASDEHIIMLLC